MQSETGPKFFIKKLAIFFFGIVIPLGSFLLSGTIKPFWKGGANFGFLSLLLYSKSVFLPLVIVAVVAFFRTQIYPRREPTRWDVIGLCLGTIVSVLSLITGFIEYGTDLFLVPFAMTRIMFYALYNLNIEDAVRILLQLPFSLLVDLLGAAPFYTPVWYGIATWKSMQQRRAQATSSVAIATFTSIPFMGAALLYAQKLYENLPDTAPDCYIVTATAMAPARFVQTIHHPISHHPLSRQLLILKAFEYAWMESAGVSHSFFRSLYDVVGPVFARLINKHALLALFAYFSLKPVEFVAWQYLEYLKRKRD